MNATNTSVTDSTSTPEVKVDLAQLFGSGRYSPLMREVYTQSQVVFKLDEEQAEKLARAVASDFGGAMANVQVKATVGKSITKDGKVTCKEAAAIKGITITNALFAMQTLAWCAEAGKHGILWGKTDWQTPEDSTFGKYLRSL